MICRNCFQYYEESIQQRLDLCDTCRNSIEKIPKSTIHSRIVLVDVAVQTDLFYSHSKSQNQMNWRREE